MGKSKYKFNQETLTYEKVKKSSGERILQALLFSAPAVLVGGGLFFVLNFLFTSPKERMLERKLQETEEEYRELQKRVKLLGEEVSFLEEQDNDVYRSVFAAEPYPRKSVLGYGGTSYDYLSATEADIILDTRRMIEELENRAYYQSMSYDEILNLAKQKDSKLRSVPSIQPVANKDLKRMASGYGWRTDPIYHNRRMHWGMDFSAPRGTEIVASGDGVVVLVKTSSWGYGKEVVIDHGFGYQTRYAHMSKFKVKKGDVVKRGQVIGLVGNTGKSVASHLHYEVIHKGKKVNPINYYHDDLSDEDYEKMVAMINQSNTIFD